MKVKNPDANFTNAILQENPKMTKIVGEFEIYEYMLLIWEWVVG